MEMWMLMGREDACKITANTNSNVIPLGSPHTSTPTGMGMDAWVGVDGEGRGA